MKKKKVTVVLSLGAAALLLIGGISVYAHQTSDSGESETVYKETTAEYGTLTVGITESGSVTIGSISQDMAEDISTSSNSGSSQTSGTQTTGTSTNNSSVALEVEEVYVSVGQQVKAGDALLKLTDESIEKYRKKLQEAVTEASADYNSAALSSAKEKVSASYSYNLSVAEGSVAQEEYEATISELQDAVDEAQEAVDESQALLTYYQEMIDSGMDLSESLADEQGNYDKLYNKLKAAKSAYTTKSVEAEKKYKEAMLSYENADSQYSADVAGVDVSVDTAQRHTVAVDPVSVSPVLFGQKFSLLIIIADPSLRGDHGRDFSIFNGVNFSGLMIFCKLLAFVPWIRRINFFTLHLKRTHFYLLGQRPVMCIHLCLFGHAHTEGIFSPWF